MQVLVYSDSLTWGIIPNTRQRLRFEQRWPGVLEHKLNESGPRVRIIEDCLNGRRTVWQDPFKPGRNGLEGLAQRIEMHSPLAAAYQEISAALGCHFFDAGSVTPASRIDGIHLDRDQHLVLGAALVGVVAALLPRDSC